MGQNKMNETVLEKNSCFEKEQKIYKIIEIQDHILTNIKFIDIDLKETDMIQQDFLVEFSDAAYITLDYFDQKAIEHNENKIRENLGNIKLIEEIKEKFQQFLPHRVVWKSTTWNIENSTNPILFWDVIGFFL